MAVLAVAVVGSPRASGQEACSCTEKAPAAAVELQITAATPEEHSRIGPDQAQLVVDLRGEQTELVGVAPQLLEGVDLAEVPVLMAVSEDASSTDQCSGARPAAGSDLSLTGQAYLEDTGPVVWTGPCQGTLTIVPSAPAAEPSEADPWGTELRVGAAVLGGLAILCLALIPLNARRQIARSRPYQ
jgi:hypothetical protein